METGISYKSFFAVSSLAALLIFPFVGCDESVSLESMRQNRMQLRLYDGAPPVIPHEIEEIGRRDCLSCHEKGNAKKNGKLAGITPHPAWTNCKQCHVPQENVPVFQKNEFSGVWYTGGIKKANPAGPPYIPHLQQYRENCSVCHTGKTAHPAVVPMHGGERSNCVQCHVYQDDKESMFPQEK